MFELVMIITLWGQQDGYHSNKNAGAGIDVETARYETREQCEEVRNIFLHQMPMTLDDLGGRQMERDGHATIHRIARCVALNGEFNYPDSTDGREI